MIAFGYKTLGKGAGFWVNRLQCDMGMIGTVETTDDRKAFVPLTGVLRSRKECARARMRSVLRWFAACLSLFLLFGANSAYAVIVGGRPYAPTSGTINNLVVFVRFADQPEFSQPLSYYSGLFNTASNSLRNFYLENSYNTLTVKSTFYPASGASIVSYQDAHPTSYYQPYDALTNPGGYKPGESGARDFALVSSALNAISAQIPAGLELDADGDGYIDHITFEVYSTAVNPLPMLFYSRSTYDSSASISLNGKSVGAYTWVAAPQDTLSYYLAATEIHEMGHSFGYPDLRTNFGRYPVGNWDVMSLAKPVHSGAYMKSRFTRWIADIPEITSYGTYTINDITQASDNAYKLRLPNSSEFLVLEYRKAAGAFESNLPGSGLCVTRINESAGIWGNLGGPPFFIYYFRADGTLGYDGSDPSQYQCLSAETGRTQLNDRSNPACFLSDGSPCGISIHSVGSAAGASIVFSVGDPATAVVTRVLSGYLANGGSRVPGATLTLSGDASVVATTGNLGNYLFTVIDGGNYTLTPEKANLTFAPASKTYAKLSSDQALNFLATNNKNTLSGNVTLGGLPASGVLVTCQGGNYPPNVTTDAAGTYSFSVNAGSDYTCWPYKVGYYAYPNQKVFTNVTTDQTQDFALVSGSATTTTTTAATTTSTSTATSTTTSTTLPATLNLSTGWNLVGNSSNTALSMVGALADKASVISVWKWLASTLRWAFYTPLLSDGGVAYAAGKGYDALTSVNGGEGFWVNAKAGFSVQLSSGTAVVANAFQNMPTGWNLISIGEDKTPSQFNQALGASPLTTLWAWDNPSSRWYFYAPSLEEQGGTALSGYIASKGYIDFGSNNKTLGNGTGFWVNR